MIIDLGKDIVTKVEGVITPERLQEALQAGTFDRLSEYSCKGINHAQLADMASKQDDEYVEINNFWGGAEAPVAILEEEVPDGFPNSMKAKTVVHNYFEDETIFNEETGEEETISVQKSMVLPVMEDSTDEDGNPITVQVMVPMLFKEYCRNYRISVDGEEVLFRVGYTDNHGNLLHKVSDSELRAWINTFSIDKITVWKDYKDLLRSGKYNQSVLISEFAKTITDAQIDGMTVAELDVLITAIERECSLDLITNGLLKAEKVLIIKQTLGIDNEL